METEIDPKRIDEFVNGIDFAKGDGLVPVVVQDQRTKDVLMVAYANKEALSLSFSTGLAHYWSRSRSSLWKKGETSGHVQKIKLIDTDCDNDTLLYVVEQIGVACHRGTWSCFDTVKKEG
ncbi:MAG: phosphoribosyl-AMP cyclohydrolase [Thaumarchaeota archaeon]|nr:phosphoribosyl-AMP cyclohydrolase [Nitrososphaerota archaeon]